MNPKTKTDLEHEQTESTERRPCPVAPSLSVSSVTSCKMSSEFSHRHLLCWFAALAVMALALPVVFASPAQPVRPQKLASPDAVPDGLSAPEWSNIREQYDQHRHSAFPVEGGYQTRNPGQQWQTRFDGRGFLTQPDAGGWQWG